MTERSDTGKGDDEKSDENQVDETEQTSSPGSSPKKKNASRPAGFPSRPGEVRVTAKPGSGSWRVGRPISGTNGYYLTFDNTGKAIRTDASKAKVESLPKDVKKETSEADLVDQAVKVTPESRSADARARSEELQNEILEAERDRVRQQKGHRTGFFFWAIFAISIILIFNCSIFAWHMVETAGKPNDAVIISWMSTSIVEVIGLGYIIARSLFLSPSGAANGSRAAARAID